MNVTKITDEYDNITSSNYTNYDNLTISNCTNNESNFDLIIPTFLLTTPCDLSFLCLMGLMVYTIIRPLFNNK